MGDGFQDLDLDTPTEHDLDLAYGSRYLSVADVGNKKIRTRISKVRKEEMRTENGKMRTKFVLYLESLDKPMVVNSTNKDELVTALGKNPRGWVGASIGIFVDPSVMYGGQKKGGLRLRVLQPPSNGTGNGRGGGC